MGVDIFILALHVGMHRSNHSIADAEIQNDLSVWMNPGWKDWRFHRNIEHAVNSALGYGSRDTKPHLIFFLENLSSFIYFSYANKEHKPNLLIFGCAHPCQSRDEDRFFVWGSSFFLTFSVAAFKSIMLILIFRSLIMCFYNLRIKHT